MNVRTIAGFGCFIEGMLAVLAWGLHPLNVSVVAITSFAFGVCAGCWLAEVSRDLETLEQEE